MAVWNTAFEASPPGGESPSLGDNRIRELKAAIRERLAQEHTMNLSSGTLTEDGWHEAGSAKIYVGSTAPVTRPDMVTALDGEDDGRLWLSSFDFQLRVYRFDSVLSVDERWEVVSPILGIAENYIANPLSRNNTLGIVQDGSLTIAWDSSMTDILRTGALEIDVPAIGVGRYVDIPFKALNLNQTLQSLAIDFSYVLSTPANDLVSVVLKTPIGNVASSITALPYNAGALNNISGTVASNSEVDNVFLRLQFKDDAACHIHVGSFVVYPYTAPGVDDIKDALVAITGKPVYTTAPDYALPAHIPIVGDTTLSANIAQDTRCVFSEATSHIVTLDSVGTFPGIKLEFFNFGTGSLAIHIGSPRFVLSAGSMLTLIWSGASWEGEVMGQIYRKEYTTSGTFDPAVEAPGFENFRLTLVGAGGGGGSGGGAAFGSGGNTLGTGGGSGAPGAIASFIAKLKLGAVPVIIGAGGAGAPATVGYANGTAGNTGGATGLGTFFVSGGGGGGGGLQALVNTARAGGTGGLVPVIDTSFVMASAVKTLLLQPGVAGAGTSANGGTATPGAGGSALLPEQPVDTRIGQTGRVLHLFKGEKHGDGGTAPERLTIANGGPGGSASGGYGGAGGGGAGASATPGGTTSGGAGGSGTGGYVIIEWGTPFESADFAAL